MRATVMHGPSDVRVDEVPDPILILPTDAIVRVHAACVCGSDLWAYRGIAELPGPTRYGHEFIGTVEDVGTDVRDIDRGDFVVAPFNAVDGTCTNCRHGINVTCANKASWGRADRHGHLADGGQGELVRVPFADTTLVRTTGHPDAGMLPSLLTLTDVMATGHHAAITARVSRGDTVVVVGDGAVGLCAIIASQRLGAERIVVMSRHPARQAMARRFGATDVVPERGADGVDRIQDLLDGGADAALECVGTSASMDQAIGSTRHGGRIGCVGVPHLDRFDFMDIFSANRTIGGGGASVRTYLPELLTAVENGDIDPGAVFDLELPLAEIADGYAAMDQRRSIKTLIRL